MIKKDKISTGLVLRGTDKVRLEQGARELVGILAGMGGEPDLLEI